ncbi:hypothetical protein H0H93_001493 [Arthromyces matolae]|nr:hypothetical protein H0H93_001493 [Arthromyces matolae]
MNLLSIVIVLLPSLLSGAQIVDLGYASYQGTFNATTGNTRFLGIRYAASPTGTRRWRPPITPERVAGVIEANVEPAGCPSSGAGIASINPLRTTLVSRAAAATSEDCLFLNVVTPQMPGPGHKAKPVVVWIHGGGYQAGNAAPFAGEDLIGEANGGVVAVAIQYRLGVYGFLPGNEVKSGGALNAGLRTSLFSLSVVCKQLINEQFKVDQEFALQWVQKHVGRTSHLIHVADVLEDYPVRWRSSAGHDLGRIRWWELSCSTVLIKTNLPTTGAGSVLQHVIAHGGKTSPPLFRAAITSSTFLPSQYAYNDPIPQILKCPSCTSAADSLACLRTVDTTTLQAVNLNISTDAFFGTFIFVPVVDGAFITQRPILSLQASQVNGGELERCSRQEALLSVTNTFEGFNFVNLATAATVTTPAYVGQLFPKFGEQQIQAATAAYANTGAPIDQAIAIMGESIFICPTYFLLRAFKEKAFKGAFAIPPAHHGDDVVYYFPSQSSTGLPPFGNPAFDKAFSHSFLDFAMSLNTNIKSSATITPQWNVWADGSTEMLFNETVAGVPLVQAIQTSSSLLKRCA